MNNSTTDTSSVFLRLAFRPLFFSAALFSVLAMLLWLASLEGKLSFNPYGGSLLWHSHEMLFGFAAAVVVGFLLTAVQNWTGVKGLNGTPLAILFICWLTPRILLALPEGVVPSALMLTDLIFLPLAAYFMSRPIIAAGMYRNLFFVPILLLMLVANITFHIGIAEHNFSLSQQGLYGIAALITLLMTVLGGRVFPMFTANGTQTAKVAPIPWLEKGVIGGTALCGLLMVSQSLDANTTWLKQAASVCFIVVGLLHSYRLSRWRPQITLTTPLLWSLHGAYGFIALGFILMGLSVHLPSLQFSTALHCILAGGIGGMTISMMSRVSLGHTGRPLQAAKIMALAFALVLLSGLLRTLTVWLLPQSTSLWLLLAGAAWVLGFAIFCICYWPVLSQSRLDGKAG